MTIKSPPYALPHSPHRLNIDRCIDDDVALLFTNKQISINIDTGEGSVALGANILFYFVSSLY